MGYKRKWLGITLVIAMLLSLVVVMGATAEEPEPTYTEVWDGRGTDSLDCNKVGDGPRTEEGWIHWVFSTKGESTNASLELDGTGNGIYAPGEPINAEVWHFYTPYFELDGLTATISLYGGNPGPGGGLVISDYCPGGEEELTVTKTVVTSYTRTHDWDIEKEVTTDNEEFVNGTPKIYLYPDGSGDETATWEVCVTYLGFEDSGFNVSGEITIKNTGDFPAVITNVEDTICGTINATVVWPDGFEEGDTLAVHESIILTYSASVTEMVDCDNVVTVTTERDTYSDTKPISWGEPDEEVHATVEVTDTNEGFADEYGVVALDADDYTAGDKECFEYSEDFAWEDYTFTTTYSSWEIENTAEVIGDDDEVLDSADAKLKINWYDEKLVVTKTVETYYEREHFWDIDKKVETENEEFVNGTPKVWLYIDGSGDETATWTVDVTYESFEDKGFVVFGTITIENTGDLDAVITDIEDRLASSKIIIYYDDEYTDEYDPDDDPIDLEIGETLTLYYREFVDSKIAGFNAVVVTTEIREYGSGDVAIPCWGDPGKEINETVNIKDISDLFGEIDLGTVSADDGDAQFTYTKDFAWTDYGADGCGSYQYDNTATIVETGQTASANLKVNVQCYIDETAFAKGDNAICFIPTFRNWGWTNPIMPGAYEMELWAGAGQCDTSKGTLVGSVTVVYGVDGYVTVTYNVEAPYLLLEEHVYVGYDKFPQMRQGRRTVSTVAPGQYYNNSPFDGSEVYVIAHAVVGMPDPDFGP